MAVLKEFFGFGGYQRLAEGFLSWQHLLFVSILNILMAIFALAIGYHFKTRSTDEKNRVLVASAIAVDALELFKIVVISIRSADPLSFLNDLPLFLCSVHLIAIPMAAFGRGRLREASLDFVCVFGLLGAVLGTYCAGNNYSVYPVLSLDNVVSGLTHILSGFASLYILISGMASMKKQNIRLTVGILLGFCAAAWLANLLLDYNYMFL